MTDRLLLMGDEAVARGAEDAAVGSAYGYPGTPSTEILETLIYRAENRHGGDRSAEREAPSESVVARWCTNEKAAYETALGASLAGRRAMVTMKHVGLNVAADPFMNSALVDLAGGLVVAVADDPGMHSSQNEQDTRYYADFARTVCLEPADQQEAYEMTRTAFALSEELELPVIVRLVTRIAHARGIVQPSAADQPGRRETGGGSGWMLLPANARNQWTKRVDRFRTVPEHPVASRFNHLTLGDKRADLAVVSAGIGRAYFEENAEELAVRPHHLHIGYYPIGANTVADLPKTVRRVVVLEDGYPYLERQLRALLPPEVTIQGRESGALPATGELTPENVRTALGLPGRSFANIDLELPGRPPQLCDGCPHTESFAALNSALSETAGSVRTSDIGCYALGALPPHSIADSVVCMGASIGMAKGAAEAGVTSVVATIGDSTFLHSGIPALIDAAEADTPMTIVILDNSTVAMTGGQPTATTSERISGIVEGLGVDPDHILTLKPTHRAVESNADALRRELNHPGLSVVIARRACVRFPARSQGRAG